MLEKLNTKMPPKRKPRLRISQLQSRVQSTYSANPPPNVTVKSDHGSQIEEKDSILTESQIEMRAPQQVTMNKFAQPQFNTMVRKGVEVTALQEIRAENNAQLGNPTMAQKVTQMMNFSPNRVVFQALVPLNVNDSICELARTKIVPPKPSSNKPIMEEPQLADYVEKLDKVHLTILEPRIDMDFPPEDFDFLHAYKRVYNYN